MKARHALLVFTALACCFSIGCSRSGVTLQGSGATFPAPLYKRWFLEYYLQHPDVRVNYQPIGSSAGIRQFTEGLTHLGASDAAMSPPERELFREQRGVDALLLPMTAGSIVLSYNVPGAPSDLKLSRKAYLSICQGSITSWDDKAIAEANPGIELPDLPIILVRRAEGSGTTYAFTSHLDAVGKAVGLPWKPGVGKSVVWREAGAETPREIGARGNSGVAAIIQQTPGAIGYLEYGYADLVDLPMARLENKAGKFVKADTQSGRAALEGAAVPKDLIIRVSDPESARAYPIVTYTWMLCYQEYNDEKIAATLKEVLMYCLKDGQSISAKLGYLPLPEDVAKKVQETVDSIRP
jgi:phosphate transport system substrate-binding protein